MTDRRSADMSMKNAMSIDVEEHFQVYAFSQIISKNDWDHLGSRVENNVRSILDLLDQYQAKATFFTLGWVAERHPSLIKEIAKRGHEMASHGYEHDLLYELTPKKFEQDVRKTKEILEDLSGQKVSGYRAPTFSINPQTSWAFEILAQTGYLYSSSVNPIRHDLYGYLGAPRFKYHPIPNSTFLEIPMTTFQKFTYNFPASGGGYFRLLPYALFRYFLEYINDQEGEPTIFYFHPWEIDPKQPVIQQASLKSKFRHYYNLKGMQGKFENLLRDFAWGRMDEIFLNSANEMNEAKAK